MPGMAMLLPLQCSCFQSDVRIVLSDAQYVYTGSLNPEAFKRLGAVYKRLKEAKGIIGPVPTQMSEDETKIDSSVTFDLASNTLVGFCGDEGDGHTCSLDGVRVDLPPGPDGIFMIYR